MNIFKINVIFFKFIKIYITQVIYLFFILPKHLKAKRNANLFIFIGTETVNNIEGLFNRPQEPL